MLLLVVFQPHLLRDADLVEVVKPLVPLLASLVGLMKLIQPRHGSPIPALCTLDRIRKHLIIFKLRLPAPIVVPFRHGVRSLALVSPHARVLRARGRLDIFLIKCRALSRERVWLGLRLSGRPLRFCGDGMLLGRPLLFNLRSLFLPLLKLV